jgi:hypothetical protein
MKVIKSLSERMKENWYVDCQTGLGEGIYSKDSFSLEQALKDQMNIYNENPDE